MRFYLYASMLMCVVDFIKSYRVGKYRKHVDNRIEMIRATMNIFLPIYRYWNRFQGIYIRKNGYKAISRTIIIAKPIINDQSP